MKNPSEVLKKKELELQKIKKEVEALRLVAPLLGGQENLAAPVEDKVDLWRVLELP